ncbi:MAG: 4Fe-4S binding protein [Candidatus Cloacimonetes bacterium]|jgi:polyferredoxin|nr:4Fe-4S binding protein [Candidatus Cloacimonadota bacterium]MDD2506210.1 4Fe-4S binding protein [Candidatus Cloacimonadota bacterium]MDD4147353.1 4Fe-4S binding protein [Candidatus Cloacimonadota bacterium]MDD4559611.1 4Fe-4S binding protein [Candidatus Cloacimonadota bacterium]
MSKRNLIQTLFLVLTSAFLTSVIVLGKNSIHSICPYAVICFGMLKGNLLTLSLGLASVGIFFGILFMILAMFWGRVFCSYVCPLGTIQELLYRITHKKRLRQIPLFAERKLNKIKYFVLGISIILVICGFAWLYIKLCPFYSLSLLPRLVYLGLFTILVIVIGGVFLERFWCRFLCPYAALLIVSQILGGLFGIKRKKIRRNMECCTDCGICNLNCPMNLDILCDEYVESIDCIMCDRCAEKCPKHGTITKEREQ